MKVLRKFNNFKNLFSVILIILLLIGCNGCNAVKKPLQIPAPKKLQVMAFYEKGWNDLTFGFPSLKAHYKDISIIMPYWYTLNTNGSIKVSAVGLEPDVIAFMRQHPEIKLLPLINKDLLSQSVLTDPNIRATAINNIVKTIEDNKFDGINIDFELLPPQNRDDLTVFVRDLAKQLHAQKK